MSNRAKKLNVADLCFVCMASSEADTTDTTWFNIITDSDALAENGDLISMIEEVTGSVVKSDKGLPQRICPSCQHTAKIAFKFKQRFEGSLLSLSEQMEQYGTHANPEDENIIDCESLSENHEESLSAWSEWKEPDTPDGNFPFEIENSQNGVHTEEHYFKCSHCPKTFNRKSGLNDHLRTHTGERPFACSQCPKTFSNNSILISHLRTHSIDRPFQCLDCWKSFPHLVNLKNHLRTHTEERPFKCSYCLKSFRTKGILDNHIRTHTGERPFQCSVCQKAFSRLGILEKHIGTHTGERPFKCTDCPKAFSRKNILVEHLRTHTGEKPFKCLKCPKTFSHSNSLKNHLQRHK